MMPRLLPICAVFFTMAGVSCSAKPATKILTEAEEVELYSLNPEKKEDKAFHGWAILGKTLVKDAGVRKQIAEAVSKAQGKGAPAKCFNPRHGIRATHKGTTVDLVICFECEQVQVWIGEESEQDSISVVPEKLLDEVLTKAGVPLAKKRK